MAGRGRGWVTAEYGMLPASTGDRKQRDVTKGRADGRTVEIQRLIGRSLRGVVDFEALGERTVYVDCDVLQADGGTRCASITGGFVALELACQRLVDEGKLERRRRSPAPSPRSRAAIVDGVPLLDLDYPEDSCAEVDANVVMTGDGGLVEVQATAERTPLSRAHLDDLLALAEAGIDAPARRQAAPSAQPSTAVTARPRHAQRAQAARVRAGCCRHRARAAARRVELPPETGETFAENALIKARAAAAATGRAAIADDSGIDAEALGGAPGVRSARYAGDDATDEENLAKLRAEAPRRHRRSRYICVDRPRRRRRDRELFEGRCDGHAWPPSRAASGGFGYDPVFVPDDDERRAHDGRARRRREGRDLPPRPGRAGAAGMAAGELSAAADAGSQLAGRRGSRSSPTRR